MQGLQGLKIFSGNSNPKLASKIAKAAGVELGFCQINSFADGEIQIEVHESVRGEDVFIVQSTCPPANQNYMELFILMDALRRASAASITVVIPYYGYARQDRKVAPRAPISAKLMADLLTTAGADRVVSVDLHAAQIQGFFNVPVDHLFAIPTLARAWREKFGFGNDFVAVSPDAGGVERTRAFAKRLECSMAIIDKRRSGPNEAKALHLIGDVTGKTAIIVDDMVDTAGTLTQAVESLYKNGASKVYAMATHPVLSGPAVSRLMESRLEKLWVTDTIPLSEAAENCGKIEVVTVAPLLAEAIKRIHGNDSVSSLFDESN
ncbi:MAG: phosphoribosylpyrophosphate synthetase [Bdellovibrio sp. SCN 50-8]|nr:MAG: phosphoribosylpyrophosphate synthetase [Bdellovibrio sp. SCN 50-8]